MSEVIVIGDDDDATDVVEIVEAVAEAITEAVTEIVEAVEDESTDDAVTDIVLGGLVVAVETLTAKVEQLESDIVVTESLAELAVDIAADSQIDVLPMVEEYEEETETVEDDVPPPTRRGRFGNWFFG